MQIHTNSDDFFNKIQISWWNVDHLPSILSVFCVFQVILFNFNGFALLFYLLLKVVQMYNKPLYLFSDCGYE